MPTDTETKTQHTPGPWEAFETTDPTKAAPVGVLDGDRNIRLCNVGVKGMPIEEINANARLMAAAPDLLAAAREAIEVLDSMPWAKGLKWQQNLRDAVRKAEEGRNA